MLFFCLVSFLFCFVFLNFIIIAKVELKEKIIIFIRPCKLFLMVFLKPRGGGFLSRASTAGMRGAPLNTLPISSGSVQSPVAPAVTDETSRTKFTVFACAEEGGSYHNLNFSACHPSPPSTVCALSLGGLEGCSGGHSSSLVLLRAECGFSPLWCSLWLTCPCFEPRLMAWFSLPPLYSDLTVVLVFKLLPLTCNPCLSCLFISVCTAFPPCVCSAPSCAA